MKKFAIGIFCLLATAGIANAEVDMSGKILTDPCEKAALKITIEKACINCSPNEPLFRFKSIQKVDLKGQLFGNTTNQWAQLELFEILLFEVYDGDSAVNRDRRFFAVVDKDKECKMVLLQQKQRVTV